MKFLALSVLGLSVVVFDVSAACISAHCPAPITLSVDLRDAPRRLLHATEIIPARPGRMTLAYPKWLPGAHVLGPVGQQAGLFITAHQDGLPAATRIPWDRDPIDLYLYHLTVPRGVSSIEVTTDFITSTTGTTGVGSTDANIAVLDWNGTVSDVHIGGPAQTAGFGPGMKLLTVNEHPFSIEQLQQAIRDATEKTASIVCTVDNTGVMSTLALPYHGGEQYPVLERIPGTEDRLLEIAAPR